MRNSCENTPHSQHVHTLFHISLRYFLYFLNTGWGSNAHGGGYSLAPLFCLQLGPFRHSTKQENTGRLPTRKCVSLCFRIRINACVLLVLLCIYMILYALRDFTFSYFYFTVTVTFGRVFCSGVLSGTLFLLRFLLLLFRRYLFLRFVYFLGRSSSGSSNRQ